MTLGEFRKLTDNLGDNVKLNFSYGSVGYPVTAIDTIDENNIFLGGDTNIMGSVRVATEKSFLPIRNCIMVWQEIKRK